MKKILPVLLLWLLSCAPAKAHEIYFCNEAIPTSREFVANKLMNVIRNQIPNVTLATLRYKARYYFPYIEAWLKYYNIPQDFKYIPIVECGFRNVSSGVGARGFWQLMPDVAKELGLVVTPSLDERDNPGKATVAACKLIQQHYSIIKRNLNMSSWVLTAACYNFGPGNVLKTVKRQGTDYFNMQLNAETAEYVYRLIAVKELFERPELYMSGFGANIFSDANAPKDAKDVDVDKLEKGPATSGLVDDEFGAMDVKVAKTGDSVKRKTRVFYVAAQIVSEKKAKFRDGGLISFELLADLNLPSGFHRKGNVIKGVGWMIDDRVFIDMGMGRDIEVLDKDQARGLTPADAVRNKEYVMFKTEVDTD